jgi:superfamily I DNA/RNA helicase
MPWENDGWQPTKEIRIFGPPGTGKTTYLARQIALAAEKYGSENVIVASFTRTAAIELNSRMLPIPRNHIGTLHALCYQNFHDNEIAELHINEFNEERPEFALSSDGMNSIEDNLAEASYKTNGDRLLNAYNLQRARCHDLDMLSTEVKSFIHAWEQWKLKKNYIDFTNMIDLAITFKSPPPDEATIGFFDEAQDFNKLQMKLVRSWGEKMKFFLLGLDDDQAIFSFTGADPMAVLEKELPDSQKRILQQSYRVPRAVQEYAENWIKKVSFRQAKKYNPRDEEGSVSRVPLDYRHPEYIIETLQPHLDAGKDIMFLATCGYMLENLKQTLRHEGIPFYNPYRPQRGDWNPLGSFKQGRGRSRISSRERLLAFLSKDVNEGQNSYWNMRNLALWIDLIKSRGILKPKAKERVEDILDTLHESPLMTWEKFMQEIFTESALGPILARDVDWLKNNLLASKLNGMEYPLKVLRKRGRSALEQKPQIKLGTIHSVKGGESDVVVLFPDVSLAGYKEIQTQEGKDSMIRTFYVGMTRCRSDLIICNPATSLHVKI